MKIIIKEPGKTPVIAKCKNSLNALQTLVGGYIETVNLSKRVVMIVNEEGKMIGLPGNFTLNGENIVGTAVFAGIKGDEFTDCPWSPIDLAIMYPEIEGGVIE